MSVSDICDHLSNKKLNQITILKSDYHSCDHVFELVMYLLISESVMYYMYYSSVIDYKIFS